MRTSIFALLLTATALYAEDFTIKALIVPPSAAELFVSTSGTPPSASALEDASHWMITAKAPAEDKGSKPGQAPVKATAAVDVQLVGKPQWSPSTSKVTLKYAPPPGLNGADPHTWTWKVGYTGPSGPLAATSTPRPAGTSSKFLSAAKDKSSSDIYLLGTFLSGEGTKPLYTLDSKIGWVPELGTSGFSLGVEGTVTINSTAKPPVNRTQTDPDSITADLTVRYKKSDLLFFAYPLKGEFARKYPASSFVPAFTVQWAPVKNISSRQAIAFYPSVGIEAGTNLNKPSKISSQPVDLSNYNTIFRGVLGAFAAYYVEAKKPDSGNPYVFEITCTFVDRVLAAAEPFITTSILNGKSLAKVILGTNPREYIETAVTWNITPLLGLTVKDTWGSLPPMFAFTGQQVTVGLTFKAKLFSKGGS